MLSALKAVSDCQLKVPLLSLKALFFSQRAGKVFPFFQGGDAQERDAYSYDYLGLPAAEEAPSDITSNYQEGVSRALTVGV